MFKVHKRLYPFNFMAYVKITNNDLKKIFEVYWYDGYEVDEDFFGDEFADGFDEVEFDKAYGKKWNLNKDISDCFDSEIISKFDSSEDAEKDAMEFLDGVETLD